MNKFALVASSLWFVCANAAADGLERLPNTTRPIRYLLNVTPDKDFLRFDASVAIHFEVLRATSEVQLQQRDLDVSSAKLDDGAAAAIRYDKARERVVLGFPRPLKAGRHEMTLTYSGHLTENVDGMFRVDYPTPQGSRRMLFTQTCCINSARLVVPSWDEPDYKAIFELQLIVPANVTAVANMPAESRTVLPDGRARIRFQPTPRMSTYLLFFAAGDFDRISRNVGATEVSVLAQQGKAKQGHLALDASTDVLRYYTEYFDIAYPLPKLDHVAMPGAGGFGAMENWGSIFYFEPRLLFDPALGTERDRISIYSIVAHEVAHQWFGNLVTPRWWDDIWLNEGFASWMESKATDRFHPEWQMPLHVAEDRETALRLDALPGTHPIVRKLTTIEQAVLAFDGITYHKGSQVIQMIEAWVGEETFRTAIRAHMRDHAYGNATTSDLWRALDTASQLPVSAVARDFTHQKGVPLIDVLSTECGGGSSKTTITVRQRRFSLDTASAVPLQWRVPVTAAVVGTDNVTRQIVRGGSPAKIEVPGCGPVKINRGETGYFRTRYDQRSFKQLASNFEGLSAADQLGLLNDTYGLAQGDYTPFDRYLELTDHLTLASDPMLLNQFVRSVEELYRVSEGLASRQVIRDFAQRRFGPLFAQLGWTPRAGEPTNTSILRGALIELLARIGDPQTLAEARRRLRGAEHEPALLPASLRKVVVETVGAGADATVFEEFIARASAATDSADKRLYLMALAWAGDAAIAQRTLDLAMTDLVPTPLLPPLLLAIADRHPTLTYDFVAAKFATLSPRLEATERTTFVPSIASAGSDAAVADRLLAFADEHIARSERESVQRARSIILFRDRIRRSGLPQITAWITGKP